MSRRHGAPRVQMILKRLLDLVVSGLGLVVLSPFLVIVGIAIRLDSSGPALFRQTRVGMNGKHFTMVKFRTMSFDGDDSIHRAYVADLVNGKAEPRVNEQGESVFLLDDPRVTRVGAFLRKMSLDEIPNLFNVLKGEMSLVGPRPPIPYEVELYDERAKRRITVKPGMTGLAQVSGRGTLNFEEVVEKDLRYIESWSVGLDLKILVRTIPIVLSKRGV